MTERFRPGRAYLEAREELTENPGQWEFFESEGNCAVLAGPGSGKTKALTVKLASALAHDVDPPRGVACITYSNECVRELQRRLGDLGVDRRDLFIGTLHAFCFQQIVRPFARLAGLPITQPMRVAPDAEQQRYFTKVANPLKGNRAGDVFWIPVQKYRRTMLDRDDESWWRVDPDLAELAEAYEGALHADGLVDYDDIVFAAEKLLREHEWVRAAVVAKFPVIAIDEYQDLGLALHRIVLKLVESGGRVLAVGDPDQSIYGFTGAQPWLLAELSQRPDFERVVLRFNYRSAGTLVKAAEAMLGHRGRYEAKSPEAGLLEAYKCDRGLAHQATEICQTIIPAVLAREPERQAGDIAVLYVDKYIGDVIARTADAERLPYQRSDRGAPYPKTPLTMWLERCATWCVGGWREADPRLADIIYDWQSFGPPDSPPDTRQQRALLLVDFLMQSRFNTPLHDWLTRFDAACIHNGIDWEGFHADERTAFDRLEAAVRPGGALEQMSLERFATRRGAPDRVHLMTLHGAKGLEFDVVIMMGMDQGILPSYRDKSDDQIDEARRKFYVGFTRAKREVHFTWSGFTVSPGGYRHDEGPSQFLRELSRAIKALEAGAAE